MSDEIITLFKRAIKERPTQTVRELQKKKAKAERKPRLKPDGTAKRGRPPLDPDEARTIKFVRLEPRHLEILEQVKILLRTKSTSRAIKFCISNWRKERCGNDSEVSQTGN